MDVLALLGIKPPKKIPQEQQKSALDQLVQGVKDYKKSNEELAKQVKTLIKGVPGEVTSNVVAAPGRALSSLVGYPQELASWATNLPDYLKKLAANDPQAMAKFQQDLQGASTNAVIAASGGLKTAGEPSAMGAMMKATGGAPGWVPGQVVSPFNPPQQPQLPAGNVLDDVANLAKKETKTVAQAPKADIQPPKGVGGITTVTPKNLVSQIKSSGSLDEIVSSINEGGVTFDVANSQNKGGQPLYSVSVYPERSKTFEGKLNKSDIVQYVLDNFDLLTRKNHNLGGWYDTDAKKLWLDVAATIKDKNKAIELGRQHNQKAIFSLGDFTEIPTGGTGETASNLSDIIKRIQLIERIND